jgi:hypothetical protein
MYRLIILVLGACGNLPQSAPGAEAACKDWLSAQAEYQARCNGVAPGQAPLTPSRIAWRCGQLGLKAGAGTVTFKPDMASACTSALTQLDCTAPLPASCSSVFVGTVAAGGACVAAVDCASGVCSALSAVAGPAGSCPGKCLATVGPGGDCSRDRPCQPGLIDVASGSPTGCTCVALPGDGEPCLPDTSCALTAWCDSGNICRARAPAGAACMGTSQCAIFPPSYCDAGTCARYGRIGEPCDANTPCVFGTWCQAGACAALPVSGGACGLVGGQSLGCYDSDCSVLPDPITGEYQSAGQCGPLPATGEKCAANTVVGFATACQPGSVCQGGTCLADACYW